MSAQPKPFPPKRQTLAQLQAEIVLLTAELVAARQQRDAWAAAYHDLRQQINVLEC